MSLNRYGRGLSAVGGSDLQPELFCNRRSEMARFVRLTQDNGPDVYHVNIDHIVSFYRAPNMSYTVVVVTNGKNMTVKERPDDIHVMAGS
jgi:hypothetical protein